MKNLLIVCFLLALVSCSTMDSPEKQVVYYYNIDSLVNHQKEILYRQNASIEKSAVVDGDTSDNSYTPDSAGWNNELRFFNKMNINKPVLEGIYKKEIGKDINSNLTVASYIPENEEDVEVKYLKLYYYKNLKNLKKIESVFQEKNPIYTSTRNFVMHFEDLEGKRIAVQIGTTGAEQANAVPGASVSTFDSAPLALQELVNGRVDAVVNDLPATLFAINEANLQGVKIVGELITEEYYGIAIPKNSAVLGEINTALDQIIQDGTYAGIYRKWFVSDPPILPQVAPALSAATSSSFNWGRLIQNLIKGAGVTLMLPGFSFFFGLIGGALIAFALISPIKPLRLLCRVYVDFFRGTPMLVQLFMIYFGLPALFQGLGFEISFNRFFAAVLALSLNVAAYLAEILRGGIQSIDRGQWEAAEALAMNPVESMRYVVFPQAFRRILPPLGNEFITLIKDTSLAAVIGFEELFRQGQLVVATTYRAFEIYLAVAIVYLIMTSIASYLFKWLEASMDPLNKTKKVEPVKPATVPTT